MELILKNDFSIGVLTLLAWGPSLDVRIWRLKTVPALKELKYL